MSPSLNRISLTYPSTWGRRSTSCTASACATKRSGRLYTLISALVTATVCAIAAIAAAGFIGGGPFLSGHMPFAMKPPAKHTAARTIDPIIAPIVLPPSFLSFSAIF